MTLDEYIKTHIDSTVLAQAQRALESTPYKCAMRQTDSATYKMAQEIQKTKEIQIHFDTLEKIQKMQEQITATSHFQLSEAEKAILKERARFLEMTKKGF